MFFESYQNVQAVPCFAVKFSDHFLSPCIEEKGLLFDSTLDWNYHVTLVYCFGILTDLDYVLLTTLVSKLEHHQRACEQSV